MAKQRVTNCTADWGVDVTVHWDGFILTVQDEKHKVRIKMHDGAIHDLAYGMRRLIKKRQEVVDGLKGALKA